jgi:hypothetical protein
MRTQQVFQELLKYLKKIPGATDEQTTFRYVVLPDFVLYLVVQNRRKQIQWVTYNENTSVLRIKITQREGFFKYYTYPKDKTFRATILVNLALLVNILGEPL